MTVGNHFVRNPKGTCNSENAEPSESCLLRQNLIGGGKKKVCLGFFSIFKFADGAQLSWEQGWAVWGWARHRTVGCVATAPDRCVDPLAWSILCCSHPKQIQITHEQLSCAAGYQNTRGRLERSLLFIKDWIRRVHLPLIKPKFSDQWGIFYWSCCTNLSHLCGPEREIFEYSSVFAMCAQAGSKSSEGRSLKFLCLSL